MIAFSRADSPSRVRSASGGQQPKSPCMFGGLDVNNTAQAGSRPHKNHKNLKVILAVWCRWRSARRGESEPVECNHNSHTRRHHRSITGIFFISRNYLPPMMPSSNDAETVLLVRVRLAIIVCRLTLGVAVAHHHAAVAQLAGDLVEQKSHIRMIAGVWMVPTTAPTWMRRPPPAETPPWRGGGSAPCAGASRGASAPPGTWHRSSAPSGSAHSACVRALRSRSCKSG